MRLSTKEIQRLNSQKIAKVNRVYLDQKGVRYIGCKDGSLARITTDPDVSKTQKDNTSRITDLEKEKDDITSVDKKLAKLECKLTAMNIVLG